MLANNFLALVLTFAAAVIWVRINEYAAHQGWIESKLSRKLIHIGTGPIFVLCWLLFPNDNASRYLAALVPLAITAQFFLVGIGAIKDEGAVKAMSRSGDRREILYGPLFYGIIFVVLTIGYWYDSPIGMAALMALCGGDGLADILGRRYGKVSLPWTARKSWIGMLGMFIGSWTLSAAMIGLFVRLGIFSASFEGILLPITLISLGATLVESLPLREVDNITITLTALILGHLLF